MLARFRPALSVFAGRRGALAARARSPDRASADPWRVRLSGLKLGSTPEPSVKGQGGMGLTSPRTVVSRDGGRGSPSAASLSSVAADDGDTGRNTSLGPRSQDGGSGVRSSYPPLRGAAEALSRQAFRRRSRTPVRLRHSSGSSLDAYAYATVLPTGAARTRPDQDRTRDGPGPDQGWTGPDQGWTGPDRKQLVPRTRKGSLGAAGCQ